VQAFVSTQLAGLGSWLSSALNGMVEKILSIFITPIAMLLYSLQIGFFWLIDCIQGIFRSMAGLDLYYYQGEEQSGDMVLAILMSDTVMSIFYGVLIVAIMLLFVTTFVAIIRSEFVEKGANPKGPIIGRSIKALFYFAAVPVVCLFGIWIANIFLKSLDEATSNQSSALSTTVFFAASHDANRCRSDYDFAMSVKNSEIGEYLGIATNATQEEIASAIDEAFLQKLDTPGDHTFNISGDHMWTLSLFINETDYYIEAFDINNLSFTYYYYDLFTGYSYLIGFMGGFVAASLLLSTCIGIIQRLFELSILFIVSPIMIAFMPIDDGKQYGKWRGEFIKRVGSMYGPVIGLNLLFMLLAVLRDVDIFPETGTWGGLYAVFNSIVQLIFLIVGLLAVKDFSAMISGLIGADDAMAKGEKSKEGVQKMVGRVGAGTVNAVRTGSQLAKATGSSILGVKGAKEVKRVSGEANLRAKLGTEGYFQNALKDIDKGNYYKAKNKDGSYTYKKKINGKMEKDGVELTDEEKTTGRGNVIKGIAQQMKQDKTTYESDEFNERKQKLENYSRNSLGKQLSMYTSGQGYKTGLGTAFDAFLKAGGKDVGMLGRESMVERAKNGESFVGAIPMYRGKDAFGNPIRTRGNITTHDALYKTEKDTKDAMDDEKTRMTAQEEYIAKTRDTSIAGGTLKQGDAPFKVEIVGNKTEKGNANNTGVDSSIITSLNQAMSKLSPALEKMATSAENMSKMNEAMKTAASEINSAARKLGDIKFKP